MKMGSLFSGIGGLELGLERAIPGLQTVWQVEKEPFCRSVLERHWPNTKRYDDVRTVGAHNLEPVDVICAGFPCQSISIAGQMRGLEDEEKSGLWWHVHRLVSEFQSIGRQPILVLENVANIIRVGGPDVVGSLAAIGYDCEWTIISAAQCGAPHLRRRWFGVAYPSSVTDRGWSTANTNQGRGRTSNTVQSRGASTHVHDTARDATNTDSQRSAQLSIHAKSMGQARQSECESSKNGGTRQTNSNYWQAFPTQSPVCRRDDGVSNQMDRRRVAALGNAVVPQCAEWVGQQIVNSGLLEVACSQHN